MANDFILYQKFTDIESAQEFAGELKGCGIDYHLEDNNQYFVKVYGYNQIDIAVGVSIKEQDFPKADLALENYYDEQIKEIDKSYYLFEFTDKELIEIILNPYEWGRLDYRLAVHILKERGVEISDAEIAAIKIKKINELSQNEQESNLKIALGYVLALVFPLAGIFIGLTIKYNRKILPTGEKFYINTTKDRKHAQRIISIGFTALCLYFIYFLYRRG